MNIINAMSLFSNVGIGEYHTDVVTTNVRFVIANELLPERARFYKKLHKNTDVICGDITNEKTNSKIIDNAIKRKVNAILATPPCQGMSSASPCRDPNDPRNTLIENVIHVVEKIRPSYCVIENVTNITLTDIQVDQSNNNVIDYVVDRFGTMGYYVSINRVNAADYGMPQDRRRLFHAYRLDAHTH